MSSEATVSTKTCVGLEERGYGNNLSHTSKFSNTFYCKSHEGEAYFKKQGFTSVSSK